MPRISSSRRYRIAPTKKARPHVALEFIRDDDGSLLPFAEAITLTSAKKCPPVRELRFLANGTLLWALDVDCVETAYSRLCNDMSAQAAQCGVADFDGLVKVLWKALGWSPDEARALALVFVFPNHLASHRVHAVWSGAHTRGRPTLVDRTTLRAGTLARAWEALTGNAPSVFANSLFVAAVHAAAPFLGFGRGSHPSPQSVSRTLLRERNKLISPRLRWVPPSGATD